jgi:hypothetical protein
MSIAKSSRSTSTIICHADLVYPWEQVIERKSSYFWGLPSNSQNPSLFYEKKYWTNSNNWESDRMSEQNSSKLSRARTRKIWETATGKSILKRHDSKLKCILDVILKQEKETG